MTSSDFTLADLGWSALFLSQLSVDELETLTPLRLTGVERDRARALGPDGVATLTFPPDISAGDTAVGDWVLCDPATGRIERVLDRATELARKAAGTDNRRQLIAANVDTLFVVTSCNADFNEARLERYLAMALDAGCAPVVILTKADLTDAANDYERRAWALSSQLGDVIACDAREAGTNPALGLWLKRGQTVAFVGSSGVGKSTIIAAFTGQDIATQGIREDDAKGRHTTTARSLYRTETGALVIDTPGMRELALSDAGDGIDELFDDVTELAARCRFRDCAHDAEPGCAVQAAVATGTLDAARVERWRKLRAEDARHSEALHQRRAREKTFGKIVKEAMAKKKR